MSHSLSQALWRVFNRPQRPIPFAFGGNLPYDDPDFSERMLALHLADDDGAASRVAAERARQIPWLIEKLKLGVRPGDHLLDLTCGPGLYAIPFAQAGVRVTGIDFAPAAITYAQAFALREQVADLCQFIQADVRQLRDVTEELAKNDRPTTALMLYGQLAVMSREDAHELLCAVSDLLGAGGRLCIEMLDQTRVDKQDSNWWFTDDSGLWGDTPFLHLGARQWRPETKTSLERYHIIQLESGQIDEIILCDQTYSIEEMSALLQESGFGRVEHYPHWDYLNLYDAEEWIVYVATV